MKPGLFSLMLLVVFLVCACSQKSTDPISGKSTPESASGTSVGITPGVKPILTVIITQVVQTAQPLSTESASSTGDSALPESVEILPTVVSPSTGATLLPGPTPGLPATQFADLGGRRLGYVCAGQGSPAVIIESGGLAGAGITNAKWNIVFSEVAKTTRICLYDHALTARFAYKSGTSDPVPGLRTSLDIVRDLHALLAAAQVHPPYLLVGHSLGGFHVRVFASEYPTEVVGMLLVDSAFPYEWVQLKQVLPTPAPDEANYIRSYRLDLEKMTDPNQTRGLDLVSSSQQVLASGSLGDLPLVVLSRDPSLSGLTATADMWQSFQEQLAGLSTDSTHIVVKGAGHGVQQDNPGLVINSILELVVKLRAR